MQHFGPAYVLLGYMHHACIVTRRHALFVPIGGDKLAKEGILNTAFATCAQRTAPQLRSCAHQLLAYHTGYG